MVFEKSPMHVVTARLGHDVHSDSAGKALFGVKAVGGDVDGFDRFRRRDVMRLMGKRSADIVRAIQAVVIVIARGAVHVRGKRPSGGSDGGVLSAGGSSSGNEVDQTLVVAICRQREIHYFLLAELYMHIRLIGL